MFFVLNQFIAVSHFFRKISKISVKSLLPTCIVLSSAKFGSPASLMKKKNKSSNGVYFCNLLILF